MTNLNNAETWHTLCWQGTKHGFASQVIDACTEAITLDEENGLYYNSRSLAYLAIGEFEKAQADMNKYEAWLKTN